MGRLCQLRVHEADLAGGHGGCFAQVGVGGVEDVEVGFFVSWWVFLAGWGEGKRSKEEGEHLRSSLPLSAARSRQGGAGGGRPSRCAAGGGGGRRGRRRGCRRGTFWWVSGCVRGERRESWREGGRDRRTLRVFNGVGLRDGEGGKGDPSHQTSQSQPNLISSSSVGGRAVSL